MTRINTNVTSLNARKTLARSQVDLQEALTRLSTGLRINTGKDDPAGLIASEVLRSDIISVQRAITNSQRANQMIATADSALGQVSTLLNDVRGLISEAANRGALSREQIAANQLQIDSSLEAIDRIAQVTQFQGRRLLDGSLDFVVESVESNKIVGLAIKQANFGAQSEISVAVDVVAQATRATLNYQLGSIADDVVLEIGGANGFEAFHFAAGSTIQNMAEAINLVSDALGVMADVQTEATQGQLTLSSAGENSDIIITAQEAGETAGNFSVMYTADPGGQANTSIDYTPAAGGEPGVINVQLATQAWTAASGEQLDDTGLDSVATTAQYSFASGAGSFGITAAATGPQYHGVTMQVVQSGTPSVSFDAANKVLTIGVDSGTSDVDDVRQAFLDAIALDPTFGFTAGTTSNGSTTVDANRVSGGPTLSQTVDGVGADDNNALDITAAIAGEAMNGAGVHYVAGNGTEAGITGVNAFVQASNAYIGMKGDTATANQNNLSISAVAGGDYDGTNGGNLNVVWTQSGAGTNVTLVGNTMTIQGDFEGLTAEDIVTAINAAAAIQGQVKADYLGIAGTSDVMATGGNGTAWAAGVTARTLGDNDGGVVTMSGRQIISGGTGEVTLSAVSGGKYDGAAASNLVVTITDGAGAPSVTFDETNSVLTVTADIAGGATANAIAAAINAATSLQGNKLADFFTATEANAGSTLGSTTGTQQIDAWGGGTAGSGDALRTQGAGYNHESIQYESDARAATASVVLANGSLTLTAANAGSAYNDVQIEIVDSAVSGEAQVSFTAAVGMTPAKLTINVDADNSHGGATLQDIIDGIATEGTFTAAGDASARTFTAGNAVAALDTNVTADTGSSGGEANTLYVHIDSGVTTANDVAAAMGADGNERAASLFTITNSQDNDGSGILFETVHTAALTGGADGGTVTATAQDVIDAINANATLNPLVSARLADGNSGAGIVSAFQEVATYGNAAAGTRIQFLGPEDTPNLRFVAIAGSSLGIDLVSDPQIVAKAETTLAAQNADASLVFEAVNKGGDYDDVVVRFNARSSSQSQDTVAFDSRASQATAFLDLGANADVRLTAVGRSADFNDVTVNVVNDPTILTDDANVVYNAGSKTLTISVANGVTTGAKVIEKVNAEGTFTANVDYAENPATDGTGTVTAGVTATTAGGGHEGGVLEFTIDNTVGGTTATEVVNLLTNDPLASQHFTVRTFSGTGTGEIDVLGDTDRAVTSGGILSEGTVIINLATGASGVPATTAAQLIEFLDTSPEAIALGISASSVDESDGTGKLAATTEDLTFATTGTELVDAQASGEMQVSGGVDSRFTVSAVVSGEDYTGVRVVYENDGTAGAETAEYDPTTKILTIHAQDGISTAAEVETAIERDLIGLFQVTQAGTGGGAVDTLRDSTTLAGGVVEQGASQGISLGNAEDEQQTGLTFTAVDFGSSSFVSVRALSGTKFDVQDIDGNKAERAVGTDVNALVNGIQAIGDGLAATVNTAALDLTFTVADSVLNDDSFTFNIVGGGAQFQLGPEVVSNQQARLGIASVNTAKLGGTSGRLFELRSGGPKDLLGDVIGAAEILEDAIREVTTLRGRLGAFQRTTLETNIKSLNDTLETLTAAESSIRDADFAVESAQLTRSQILVQSGLSVLSIANNNPQSVLSLLQQ